MYSTIRLICIEKNSNNKNGCIFFFILLCIILGLNFTFESEGKTVTLRPILKVVTQ